MDATSGTLAEMVAELKQHGDAYAGNNPEDEAQGWIDCGFDADDARPWLEIGFWDAESAAAMRDADLSPEEVQRGAEALEADKATLTDGSAIYAVCNGDLAAAKLIAAARNA